jgi:hypothetical protein
MSDLMLGRVVAAYPQSNTVDIVLQSSARLAGVPVLLSSISGQTGAIDLPDIGLPQDDSRWDLSKKPAIEVMAVVGVMGRSPICIGFILPATNQLGFDRPNFKVNRHASDVYSTIDDEGNIELAHPSGTFIRIATNAAHEDLSGQDHNSRWLIGRNTDRAVHLRISIANAGTEVASLNVTPEGHVSVQADGNVSVNATGNVNIVAGGSALVDADGDADVVAENVNVTADLITLNGDTELNGNLTVDGNIESTGDVAADGDVTAAAISLTTHVHPGVMAGPSLTGGPQ